MRSLEFIFLNKDPNHYHLSSQLEEILRIVAAIEGMQ